MMDDWVECKLGDLLTLKNGYAFKSSKYTEEGIPVIRIGNIKNWLISIDEAKKIKENVEYDDYIIENDDILIAMSGATTGKFGVFKSNQKAYQNQRVGNLKLNSKTNVNKKFVFNLLYSIKHQIEKEAYGGAQPNISGKKIHNLNTILPPLPIQRVIVSKIETLFSSLDQGIADLKKAQAQLKIYRQAVLKKAFEGELNVLSIKEVVEKVQIGPFGSQLHKSDYIVNGIPLINPMHIKDGKILPNENYSISIEKRDSLPNYILKEKDVIVGRRGEMGRAALVSKKENGWFCGTGSFYLRPKASMMNPAFLTMYIRSAKVKELLTDDAKGTTMKNLNKKIVSNLPIPVPTIEEQQKIIKQIESRLSVCDKVEESIKYSLLKAEALRQSILKKAFEGKLLSTEEIEQCKSAPDYEPASVLLERIKEEKR